VSHGLNALTNTKLPGLRALMSASGLREEFTARDVAFRLAPRLNASGRLNEPLLGFELLTTDSFGRALEIATELDSKNRERQSIERAILASARERLARDFDRSASRVIVLAGEDWHIGVIGIVASRLAEEFYRPTVLMCIDGEIARGSARSIPAFHILNALKSCERLLLSYGGHAQAAGITIEAARVDEFRTALEAEAERLTEEDLTPSIEVDAEMPLSAVTPTLVRQLEFLAPFGEANPQPLFAASGVSAGGRIKRVGNDGQHLSFFAKGDGASVRAIAFGHGELASRLESHSGRFSLVFEPRLDTFSGEGDAQLVVKDIRFE
jgi:single-stranded-DNA-specific exonuclease